MPGWLYVLLCLAVPSAWAFTMHLTIGAVERARARRRIDAARAEVPPIDYSI